MGKTHSFEWLLFHSSLEGMGLDRRRCAPRDVLVPQLFVASSCYPYDSIISSSSCAPYRYPDASRSANKVRTSSQLSSISGKRLLGFRYRFGNSLVV